MQVGSILAVIFTLYAWEKYNLPSLYPNVKVQRQLNRVNYHWMVEKELSMNFINSLEYANSSFTKIVKLGYTN